MVEVEGVPSSHPQGDALFIGPGADQGRSHLLCAIVEGVITELGGLTLTKWSSIDQPGSITDQLVQKIADAPFIIADLIDAAPNVYYELCIAHALRVPVIGFIDQNESPKFDVSDQILCCNI